MNLTHGVVVRQPEGSVPGVVRLGAPEEDDRGISPDWIPLCHWKADAAHVHEITEASRGVHLHVCDVHAKCIPNGTYEIEGLAVDPRIDETAVRPRPDGAVWTFTTTGWKRLDVAPPDPEALYRWVGGTFNGWQVQDDLAATSVDLKDLWSEIATLAKFDKESVETYVRRLCLHAINSNRALVRRLVSLQAWADRQANLDRLAGLDPERLSKLLEQT